jgi:predicted dehydrogenase
VSVTNIGVIGAGVLGSYHIEKCRRRADVALVGFCDTSIERCAEISGRLNVRGFESADELVDLCDALIVATPATTHHAAALSCLKRKRHVLVEKPLASSVAQGAELVRTARRAGVVLHVGHSEVFNPAFVALMRRPPQPRFMEIHRLAEFSPRGSDVSVVLDLMVHDLHLIHRLCNGRRPLLESIAAVGVPVVSRDVDIVNARLTFPSGCVVNMTASRISTKRMRKLRIFAPQTYLSVDLDSKELVRCTLRPGAGPGGGGGLPIVVTTEAVDPADPLEQELDAFVSAIRQPAAPTAGTTGREALEVLTVAEAILQRVAGRPSRSADGRPRGGPLAGRKVPRAGTAASGTRVV